MPPSPGRRKVQANVFIRPSVFYTNLAAKCSATELFNKSMYPTGTARIVLPWIDILAYGGIRELDRHIFFPTWARRALGLIPVCVERSCCLLLRYLSGLFNRRVNNDTHTLFDIQYIPEWGARSVTQQETASVGVPSSGPIPPGHRGVAERVDKFAPVA